MIEIEAHSESTVVVSASPAAVLALVVDVVDSAAHFPGLESVADQGGDVWLWTHKKVGAGRVSIQAAYGCHYLYDSTGAGLAWEEVPGLGNGLVNGRWRIEPVGDGARLTMENTIRITLPLPRMVQKVVGPLLRRENQQSISGYLHNLKTTLDGGDGRVRR